MPHTMENPVWMEFFTFFLVLECKFFIFVLAASINLTAFIMVCQTCLTIFIKHVINIVCQTLLVK